MFNKPQQGDTVTVTTKYKSTLLHKDFDINVYENVRVLKSERWEGPNDFRVADPNAPHDGIRVINMKAVTDLKINDNDAEQIVDPKSATVIVEGSKGQEYVVQIVNGSAISCTCMGFQYRKKCRHLEEGLKSVDLNPELMDNT